MLRGCIFCYLGKNVLLQCAITQWRDIGLHEVPLSVSLLFFLDKDYVSQLPYVRYC